MYQNSKLHSFTKVLVDILFYVGIICVITVPIWAKGLRDFLGKTDVWLFPAMIVLMVTGACAVFILFDLKRMFKTLVGGNPFVKNNVHYLRQMAVACALIALIYLGSCFWQFTFARLIIVIIFSIAALFCLTLKDLFKQAIAYKEENELTI